MTICNICGKPAGYYNPMYVYTTYNEKKNTYSGETIDLCKSCYETLDKLTDEAIHKIHYEYCHSHKTEITKDFWEGK